MQSITVWLGVVNLPPAKRGVLALNFLAAMAAAPRELMSAYNKKCMISGGGGVVTTESFAFEN